MSQAAFELRGRNPDVLTCIANLSNDEVFTPPEFANQMLDTLAATWADSNDGANIWADKTVRFLDPFSKSGVFLREITTRLTLGLAEEIPDLADRVDHILTKQVFGIGITTLTSLLARRSLYCSKYANGPHSIAKSFKTEEGNIWFERTEHTWVGGSKPVLTADEHGNPVERYKNGKCKYCGASQTEYARGGDLETHAYAFIHTDDIKARIAELFGEKMQFDVIIGNPPFQLNDGGFGTSAAPLYHHFVSQAKALQPRMLAMITPARWFVGGKGLDEFRRAMLLDDRLRTINDFPNSNDVFPGTQIKGGVCYFLWERDTPGDVTVNTHDQTQIISSASRPLLEPGAAVFIRYNEGVGILKKVLAIDLSTAAEHAAATLPEQIQFRSLVSARKPFGFDTTFSGTSDCDEGDLTVYRKGGIGYVKRGAVSTGRHLIDEWKVFIPRAGSGSDSFPHPILGRSFVGAPGTISSETYLCIGPLRSECEASNLRTYVATRLLRFLVLLHKASQDTTRAVYSFVPLQDFSHPWTDEQLYAKYGITDDEVAFIESMIRPMELDND